MARLFVSVRPPPAVCDALASRLAPFPDLTPRRDRWHVTLRFLGAVPGVAVVARALDGLAGESAFGARLGGGGTFRSGRRRVVWVGFTEGDPSLRALAAAADRAVGSLSAAPAPPRFAAHLTLGGARRDRDLAPVLAALGEGPVGPSWTVGEVLLEESSFPGHPVRYDTVHTVTLRAVR